MGRADARMARQRQSRVIEDLGSRKPTTGDTLSGMTAAGAQLATRPFTAKDYTPCSANLLSTTKTATTPTDENGGRLRAVNTDER